MLIPCDSCLILRGQLALLEGLNFSNYKRSSANVSVNSSRTSLATWKVPSATLKLKVLCVGVYSVVN